VVRDKDRAGVKTQIFGLDLGIGTGTETLMTGSMPTKVQALTQTSGSITTSSSTVTATTDVSNAGTITVCIFGTYAGVNAAFEASPDGTNWFPIIGQRLDAHVTETTTGVLPSNQSRAWDIPIPGPTQFRVRATAWTSGTANVVIIPAVNAFEIAPTVGFSGADTATLSQPAVSASSFTVLAANPSRRGAMIYNDAAVNVNIALAATASTTAYTYQLQAGIGYYELPAPVYKGLISGIASSATGNLRVTELT
jgi:hypothetical protein